MTGWIYRVPINRYLLKRYRYRLSGSFFIGPIYRVPKVSPVELLVSTFKAEVIFEADTPEPELEVQAEDIRLWNEGMSVLSEDRGRRR